MGRFYSCVRSFRGGRFRACEVGGIPERVLCFLDVFFFLASDTGGHFHLILGVLTYGLYDRLFVVSNGHVGGYLVLVRRL